MEDRQWPHVKSQNQGSGLGCRKNKAPLAQLPLARVGMLSGIWDMAREGWGPAPTCVPGGLTLGYSCPVLPYIPSHRQGVWWGEMEGGAGELGDPEPLGGGHQTSQGWAGPLLEPRSPAICKAPWGVVSRPSGGGEGFVLVQQAPRSLQQPHQAPWGHQAVG